MSLILTESGPFFGVGRGDITPHEVKNRGLQRPGNAAFSSQKDEAPQFRCNPHHNWAEGGGHA